MKAFVAIMPDVPMSFGIVADLTTIPSVHPPTNGRGKNMARLTCRSGARLMPAAAAAGEGKIG